jgi:hypothetical protein
MPFKLYQESILRNIDMGGTLHGPYVSRMHKSFTAYTIVVTRWWNITRMHQRFTMANADMGFVCCGYCGYGGAVAVGGKVRRARREQNHSMLR